MNKFNIAKSFRTNKERDYTVAYWCIDLHGVICKNTHKRKHKYTFYNGARKVLRFLSGRNDIILILHTCSHNDSINRARKWLLRNGIAFEYVNENTEIHSNKISNFSQKFHYNVLLDDKAGFEGEKDWAIVREELEKEYKVKIK